MLDLITAPWPWYISGPIMGLLVPALILFGGKQLGVSENLRHMCAAALPHKPSFLQYDWRKRGAWNLVFAAGMVLGGLIATVFLSSPDQAVNLAAPTQSALINLGISDFTGLVPEQLFSWTNLLTVPGLIMILGGGFLVGFGARYAGGCTSGHAISGLASFQLPSLLVVVGFFIGGMTITFLVLPILL